MTNRYCLLAAALLVGGPAVAAEPPASTDDALFRSLLGEEAEGSPSESDAADALPIEPSVSEAKPAASEDGPSSLDPQAIQRILADLRDAERGLADGKSDEATRNAQANVIEELERLIEAAKNQAAKPPRQPQPDNGTGPSPPQPGQSATPDPNSSGGTPTRAGGSGVPASDRNRDGKADESSDRAPEDRRPAALLRDVHSDLVRDAWGHLPPRLRDQLLNAGSDQYLPRYDALVRRYFESLAQPSGTHTEPRP